ncbi:MAG: amidohydrolase [Paenibacillaceae bacterium]|nr:amidohydrolase [Paenibacillaceae bacterium]
MELGKQAETIFPDMVVWRRHLHMNPELSYREEKTSRFVADVLESIGIEVRTGVGGYGIVGLLRGGKPGPTVALRADMDALPIQDEKTVPYKSQVPGVMHACGHDGHTAALLGAARLLAGGKDEMQGNAVFLFQPAEEVCPGGAKAMIADGALDGVDVVYGVHLWTPFAAGGIHTAAGPVMAAPDEFVIRIKGKGGHGALPHQTVDSIVVGAHMIVNLQTIVSRSVNPADPCVVSIGMLHAGTGFNVISETCVLSGTVRTFDPDVKRLIRGRIEAIAETTCAMFGAACDIDYIDGYPAVVNDANEARRCMDVAANLFGEASVRPLPLIMAGEDFAYYLQIKPGCFIFVGAGNEEKGATAPHHHPQFDIDEDAMKQSAALLAGLCLDYQASHAAAANG